MYNKYLHEDLLGKYFNSNERFEIWQEAQNLVKDILFFEEYMDRFKKTKLKLKVRVCDICEEKSFKKLFKDHSVLGINNDSMHEVLIKYNLAKFFINKVYNDELTEEMEKDLADFSNSWSSLYQDNGLVEFVEDFVGCSSGISATIKKIDSIVKNHSVQENRED